MCVHLHLFIYALIANQEYAVDCGKMYELQIVCHRAIVKMIIIISNFTIKNFFVYIKIGFTCIWSLF